MLPTGKEYSGAKYGACPLYEKLNTIKISTDNKNVIQIADEIIML